MRTGINEGNRLVKNIATEIFNGEIVCVCESEEEFQREKNKQTNVVVYSPDEIRFLKEQKELGNDEVVIWLHEGKKAFKGKIVLDVEKLKPEKKLTIAERRKQLLERKNHRQSDSKVPEQPATV